MKRIVALLLCIFTLLPTLPAGAFASDLESDIPEGEIGPNLEWSISNGHVKVYGSGPMYDFSSFWMDMPWQSKDITSVEICEGVTKVGRNAFCFCPNIETVSIADTVISIRETSFSDTKFFDNLTMESDGGYYYDNILFAVENTGISSFTVKEDTRCIVDGAFSYCSDIKEITIPSTITKLGEYLFYYCTSLEQVNIPDSVTEVETNAFSSCSSLETVTLPDAVTSLTYNVFDNCRALTCVNLPAGLQSLSYDAFYRCPSLKQLNVPESNTKYFSLDGVLFTKDMTELIEYPCGRTEESYSIPDGVTEIRNSAFDDCDYLKEVIFPDSVTEISDYAFGYSSDVTVVCSMGSAADTFAGKKGYNVRYTDTVVSLAIKQLPSKLSYLMADTLSLDGLIVEGITNTGKTFTANQSFSAGEYDFSTPGEKEITVYYNGLSVSFTVTVENYYDSGSCGDNLSWILDGDGILRISGTGNMADYTVNNPPWTRKNSYINTVEIKDGVTSIGGYAFEDCASIVNVRISGDVKRVGAFAFGDCSALEELILPEGVTYIGSRFIDGCTSLKSVYIPESVTDIHRNALYGCDTVTVKGSATSLGVILAYQESIPYETTNTITSLSVKIPPIQNIYALNTQPNLTGLVLEAVNSDGGVSLIPFGAIAQSYNFTSYGEKEVTVRLLDQASASFSVLVTDCIAANTCGENISWVLEKDGKITFSGIGEMESYDRRWSDYQNSITEVVIEEGITSTCYDFMRSGYSIVTVSIPNSVTEIRYSSFNNCTSLKRAIIPAGVVSIADSAFTGCRNLTIYCEEGSAAEKYAIDHSIPIHYGLDEVIVSQGQCGDNLEWSVDDIGTLTISGTGAMYQYEKNAVPWINTRSSVRVLVVEEGVTSIGKNAFYNCVNLETVSLPSTLTKIKGHAFRNCSALKTIILPDSLTSINDYAFAQCYGLDSVTLSAKLTAIPANIFNGCSSLESVVIPSGVKSIGDFAFTDCPALYNILIPESVENIREGAFRHSADLVITCYEDSYAEEYALENSIPYTYIPAITTFDDVLNISSVDSIKDMRYALGEHTTPTQIKNAEGNVAISNSLIAKHTANGVFSYRVAEPGSYTVWIRMKDGNEYFLPFKVKRAATLVCEDASMTVGNLYDVKDLWIAKGNYSSYREIKNNGYLTSVTAGKLGGDTEFTYTVNDSGIYTIIIRYMDGDLRILHGEIVIDSPVFTGNGKELVISGLSDIKVIRTAYGEYSNVKDMKASSTIRNYISVTEDSFTINFKKEGVVTVTVEYKNGRKIFYNYVIE